MISSLLISEDTLSMLASKLPILDTLILLGSTLCLIILNIFILPHVHLTTVDGERKRTDVLGVITYCLYITFVMLYISATPKTVMRLIEGFGPYIR